MTSEEIFAFGDIFPRQETFYSFQKANIINDGQDDNSLGGFQIIMSLDTVVHNRVIYNVFDWLGDIGGLLGILASLGGVLMSMLTYCFGSKMDRFLTGKLFKFETPDLDDDLDAESFSTH